MVSPKCVIGSFDFKEGNMYQKLIEDTSFVFCRNIKEECSRGGWDFGRSENNPRPPARTSWPACQKEKTQTIHTSFSNTIKKTQQYNQKKKVSVQSDERVAKDVRIVVPISPVQPGGVDFSRFEVDQLQSMVIEVGVDSAGMNKTDLIESCRKHEQLSESWKRF